MRFTLLSQSLRFRSTDLRRLARQPMPQAKFLRLAKISLFFLLGIMVTGSLVRLTNSGLGCPNWPSCHGDVPIPPLREHSLIEFSNRVWSIPTLIFSALCAVASFRLERPRRNLRIGSCLAVGGVCGQIVLGGITVLFDLHPLLVASHFALSILILAAATYTVYAARVTGPLRPRSALDATSGLLLLVSCSVAVVAGILTTAAGPHSGASPTSPVVRYGNFGQIVSLHAHAAFVFAGLVLAVTIWRRRTRRGMRDIGLLCVLVGIQIGLGEWQYRTGLPWQVVLAHVASASVIWVLTCWIACATTLVEKHVRSAPPPLTGDGFTQVSTTGTRMAPV